MAVATGQRSSGSVPESAHAPVQPTILLADDSTTNRAVLRGCLTPLGYQFREAKDGFEALAQAKETDLMLLDVMMPGLSGLEVCQRLR
ncbi:MAG: response regulator, partial [Candidatus Sericytochromatia bacterium]|nr:response regulator [Candidatus Sericytochromatia bacterium]